MKKRLLITLLTITTFCAKAQTYTKVFQPNGDGEETPILMVDSTCVTFSTHPFRYFIDSNFYSHPELNDVTWTGSGCISSGRVLIRFAGISDTTIIPRHATITSATLTLYDEATSPTGNYGNSSYPSSPYVHANTEHIYILSTLLNAHTATWRTQPNYKHTDSVLIPMSTEQFGNDSTSINVTSLVQDLHTNGNNGFLIKLDTEAIYREHIFASSKATDASRHPKLKVVFNTLGVTTVNNIVTTISVYPNPANKELYIDVNGRINGTISLTDQLGRAVSTKTITNSTEKLDISALPVGIYFVRVENDAEIITSKFLKR